MDPNDATKLRTLELHTKPSLPADMKVSLLLLFYCVRFCELDYFIFIVESVWGTT